jgi:hypothetical protein
VLFPLVRLPGEVVHCSLRVTLTCAASQLLAACDRLKCRVSRRAATRPTSICLGFMVHFSVSEIHSSAVVKPVTLRRSLAVTCLTALLGITHSSFAQDVGDDDVEIEVEESTPAPAPEPSVPPAHAAGPTAPGAAPPAVEPQPPVQTAPAEQAASPAPAAASASPAEQASSPERVSAETADEKAAAEPATASAEVPAKGQLATRLPRGESLLSAGIEAEGSNYRRPLRLGFGIWGFVQAQYSANQISEDQLDADGHSLNHDGFDVPRARLRLDHGWKYAFATIELEAGTIGAPVRLRRAEASLLYRGAVPDDKTPLIVLTGGITDIPFAAELAESQRDRLFVERSLPSQAIFPSNADLGAKLWGAYEFLDYSVALINGEPLGENGWPRDPNAAKDVTGRVGAQARLGQAGLLKGGVSFYVGKGFSPGTPATKDTLQWVDLNSNGVVDSGEIQGLTGSSAIESQNYNRFAAALDLGTTWVLPWGPLQAGGELFVASNLDRGLLPNDPITSGASSRQLGASAFLQQGITRWVLLGVRGSFYDPNSNIVEQRSGDFHLKNQQFWEVSPSIALLIDRARLTGQYDFVFDHLGRDSAGVPSDVANNRWTIRLQVDL